VFGGPQACCVSLGEIEDFKYKKIHPVNRFQILSSLALAAALVAGSCTTTAQPSSYERFRAQNDAMAALQPAWMGPLIQSDSRLSQAVRLSVSNAYAPNRTVNYGNGHGISTIVGNRLQLDFMQPAYVQNNSAKLKDGFGNAEVQVKFRIASGNAQHGNYALTAILVRSFTPGSQELEALTGAWFPKLGLGRAWGRFNVQTMMNGVLPTGKVSAQGRAIEWNTTAQIHPNAHVWLDVEENAAFNIGGPVDGKIQNFITPAAFYMVRRKNWKPTHAMVVFDAGMQIATSGFYFYNHNLISEARILF
jgi:hypothetical protein